MLYGRNLLKSQPHYKHCTTRQKQRPRVLSESIKNNKFGMSVSFDGTECCTNGTGSCNVSESGHQNYVNTYYEWKPGDIINGVFESCKSYACLVLNRFIRIPSPVVRILWQNAYIRCTVDGGTNRWRHYIEHVDTESLKLPDLVVGDFDSITEESRRYFTNGFTKFLHTPDQNATDFTKAVDAVRPLLLDKKFNDVIVFHETSGRFDHIMANLNTLYKESNTVLNIYLLGSNSLTWLLRPGCHRICIPTEILYQNNTWCSLIPVGNMVTSVSTTGLKWNLNKTCLRFGCLVSTSNTYVSDLIEIETNGQIIWSMGLFSFIDD